MLNKSSCKLLLCSCDQQLKLKVNFQLNWANKILLLNRHSTQRFCYSFERFERDFGWKVYFAGEEDQDLNIKSKSKLYTKSKNRPQLPPPDIRLCVVNFEIAIRKLLGHHPHLKSIFTPFQEKLIEKLRQELNIVFASAYKNPGHVAATLEQYTKDGLLHLQDEDTSTRSSIKKKLS